MSSVTNLLPQMSWHQIIVSKIFGREHICQKMFVWVYVEYTPCRCPFISMCRLIDDGGDCLQLELALTETDWWLSCPWSENLQPKMALSSWWPTSYLMASLTHGLSLEEEWQLVLCMVHLGGEVTWQRWSCITWANVGWEDFWATGSAASSLRPSLVLVHVRPLCKVCCF